jgi:PIN domain nuclease of toxin-antitoxin system
LDVLAVLSLGWYRTNTIHHRACPVPGVEKVASRMISTIYRQTFDDVLTAGNLPPHDNDPFDWMLVAHALRRNLTLVSPDRRLTLYDLMVVPG